MKLVTDFKRVQNMQSICTANVYETGLLPGEGKDCFPHPYSVPTRRHRKL